MNKRALIVKISLSLVVSGIAAAAIISAWSPLLVTYVPIEQAYDVSANNAEIIETILTARVDNFTSALNVSSALVLINLLVALAITWAAKFNGKPNT